MTTDDDENLCTSPFGVANSDVRYTGRLSQWRAGCFDAMEPDDAWYVEPRIRVTGPSVRDISLYPEGEGARLLREDLAFRRKSVGNEAGFRRVRRAMHKRQEKTPVAALRGNIQRTSRERIARALDPETIRRRASWTDSSASAARYQHAHREDSPKISPGAPRAARVSHTEEGARGGCRGGCREGYTARDDDDGRHAASPGGVPTGDHGVPRAATGEETGENPREGDCAARVVGGGGTETRAEEGDVSGSEGESNGTARAVGGRCTS